MDLAWHGAAEPVGASDSLPSAGGRALAFPAGASGDSSGDSGFSLIEVVVSMAIFSLFASGLVSVLVAAPRQMADSQLRVEATAVASRALERARDLPRLQLAMHADVAPGAQWDPDATGPMPAEQTVQAADGLIAAGVDSPFWGSDGPFRYRTYVTVVPVPGSATGARRITVSVTWGLGDRAREVRQSTIVAAAAGGAS